MIVKWLVTRLNEWFDMFEGLIVGAFWFWIMVSIIFGLVLLTGDPHTPDGEPISNGVLVWTLINFVAAISAASGFIGVKIYRRLREDFRNFVANYEKPKREEYDPYEQK